MSTRFSIPAMTVVALTMSATGVADCDPSKLLAEMPSAGDLYGRSLATDGDRIVVGADAADVDCGVGGCDVGVVEVFVNGADGWTREAVLRPLAPMHRDAFGTSVSIDGRRIAVGSLSDEFGADAGAVDIFELDKDGQWAFTARLGAPDPQLSDEFGRSVKLLGDLLVVGAPGRQVGDIEDAGAAMVFEYDGGTWNVVQVVEPTHPSVRAGFGAAIDIDGDLLVVGSPFEHVDGRVPAPLSGAAYVFVRSGDAWTLSDRLTAPHPGSLDIFGIDVAAQSPDLVLIGAPGDDDAGDDAGAVHAFRRDGASWILASTTYSITPVTDGRFGSAVGVVGGSLVIGESGGDTSLPDTGSAYLFDTGASSVAPVGVLLPNEIATGDRYGDAIAFAGTVLVIGAPRDDDACPASPSCDSGAAWVFRIVDASCPGDLDGDRVVGISDLLHLLANWGAIVDSNSDACIADLNEDGGVDSLDLTELIQDWGACG